MLNAVVQFGAIVDVTGVGPLTGVDIEARSDQLIALLQQLVAQIVAL